MRWQLANYYTAMPTYVKIPVNLLTGVADITILVSPPDTVQLTRGNIHLGQGVGGVYLEILAGQYDLMNLLDLVSQYVLPNYLAPLLMGFIDGKLIQKTGKNLGKFTPNPQLLAINWDSQHSWSHFTPAYILTANGYTPKYQFYANNNPTPSASDALAWIVATDVASNPHSLTEYLKRLKASFGSSLQNGSPTQPSQSSRIWATKPSRNMSATQYIIPNRFPCCNLTLLFRCSQLWG